MNASRAATNLILAVLTSLRELLQIQEEEVKEKETKKKERKRSVSRPQISLQCYPSPQQQIVNTTLF